MSKSKHTPQKISSISDLHRILGLPKPLHPLISLIDNSQIAIRHDLMPDSFLFDFYKISYKKSVDSKRMGYGQGYYDFDEGGLVFTAPHQVLAITGEGEYYGFNLCFHPDFIRNYALAANIKRYGFFAYDANEALHLSDKEKATVFSVFDNIKEELNSRIDDFSQDVMIAHIEVLLNYSNRFYKRQFITRKAVNHDLLTNMEQLLSNYFDKEEGLNKGLPTVEYLAAELHLSSRYLSDMLRSLTGQNAQQHIHERLIEKAKEYLTTTNLSVGEVAYQLGFEHPQSFNKLFKRKTNQTPIAFKGSFN